MNQSDRDYLEGLMLERLSHHVGLRKAEFYPNSEQFYELEYQYEAVLSALPEDKAEILRRYVQTTHDRSNARELFCFRFGFLDGFKLGHLAHELTESA